MCSWNNLGRSVTPGEVEYCSLFICDLCPSLRFTGVLKLQTWLCNYFQTERSERCRYTVCDLVSYVLINFSTSKYSVKMLSNRLTGLAVFSPGCE